jgi:hypothetical protein
VIGASKIARDITKQKEAEKLIEQYVYRLELLNVTGKALAAELDTNIILQKVTDAVPNYQVRLSELSFITRQIQKEDLICCLQFQELRGKHLKN